MNNSIKFPVFIIAVVLSGLFSFQVASAQSYSLNNSSSVLEVHGTSSLHDWTLDAEKQSGTLVLASSEDLSIKSLSMTVVAESLKSGKSGMDKNTYKALDTDDHDTMDFNLTSVKSVESIGNNTYKVAASGKMTIAGNSKTISVDLTVKLDGTKLLLNGEKSFNMTDFGVEPPTAMFGTIKTGDAVKIVFKSVFLTK